MVKKQRFYDVFVGTYGNTEDEGIEWLLFDSEKGTLERVGAASGVASPSFVTVNQARNRLYAVSEVENGEVVCFEIDYLHRKLKVKNRQLTRGAAPCYITVDASDQWLFTANYDGGNVAVHPLNDDGEIAPISDLKSYAEHSLPDKISHPHTILNIPGTNRYIVSDLGLDQLYLYEFDTELVLINEITAIAGSGPRHVAFNSLQRMMYVVNEFNSSISVYAYDENVELMDLVQQIDTIPADFVGENYCADIHIAPSGSYLYASNRGHHSIASYEIKPDGKLNSLDYSSTKGEWPRNFAIVPSEDYILAANERTNSIVVMEIGEDGIPRGTGSVYKINSPVCLQVMPVTQR